MSYLNNSIMQALSRQINNNNSTLVLKISLNIKDQKFMKILKYI